VRVLLDENLPHDLAAALTGHAVSTVQGLGWAGIKNSALLKRAGDVCDVFITMDASIQRQQKLASLPFGVVIIRAASNRMKDLLPLVPELLQVIETVRRGEAAHIGRSPERRDE
jgi:predicted nuclease of predicted toxin-antitoxin system